MVHLCVIGRHTRVSGPMLAQPHLQGQREPEVKLSVLSTPIRFQLLRKRPAVDEPVGFSSGVRDQVLHGLPSALFDRDFQEGRGKYFAGSSANLFGHDAAHGSSNQELQFSGSVEHPWRHCDHETYDAAVAVGIGVAQSKASIAAFPPYYVLRAHGRECCFVSLAATEAVYGRSGDTIVGNIGQIYPPGEF